MSFLDLLNLNNPEELLPECARSSEAEGPISLIDASDAMYAHLRQGLAQGFTSMYSLNGTSLARSGLTTESRAFVAFARVVAELPSGAPVEVPTELSNCNPCTVAAIFYDLRYLLVIDSDKLGAKRK